jgi:hypothetical protein
MNEDMARLEQATVSAKRQNEMHRVKWIYCGIGLFILIPELLTQYFIGRSYTGNWIFLCFSIFAGSAVAWVIGRDIWALRVRHSPLWVDIAMYILVLGGLGGAIFLREAGIYVWNTVYLDAFVVWLCVQVVAIAWATEKTKRVRVYLGARRLVFVNE